MKHEGWRETVYPFDLELDPGQCAQLDTFETLLEERALPSGLIAASDADRLRQRHLMDCLRAAPLVEGAERAYDLGSGAGLPGVVIAIACPGLDIVLVEPKRSRAAFLELAIERLALTNAEVHVGRAETLAEPRDLCFARAFSSARGSWEAAAPLLCPSGRVVYFAGASSKLDGLPEEPHIEIVPPPALARWGPLVIMTRQ